MATDADTVDDNAWAWVKDHGHDHTSHQHKQACLALIDCDVCGKEVELIADTEAWAESDTVPGRWDHSEYGPAQGVCCSQLYVDTAEGCFRYDFRKHGMSLDTAGEIDPAAGAAAGADAGVTLASGDGAAAGAGDGADLEMPSPRVEPLWDDGNYEE